MAGERLQKLISAAGLASRREAEGMITAGRVTVNGLPAVLGQRAEPGRDDVRVDGVPLGAEQDRRLYLMLHKPKKVLTTLRDDRGRPTVAELVSDVGARVYPVGRLDWDSEGLLLLTNDGALANALTHPSHEVDKTYRTTVSGPVAEALPLLRRPMALDGVTVRGAQVAEAPGGGGQVLDITIHEGRNRQVRRMCTQAGLTVRRLVRIAEGPLRLGDLAPGRWRYLTEGEIAALKALLPAKAEE